MIPNSPRVHQEAAALEDDLIAYCWTKFMDTGDATWLPAADGEECRAGHDAVTELMGSAQGGKCRQEIHRLWRVQTGWTTCWSRRRPARRGHHSIVIDVVNLGRA